MVSSLIHPETEQDFLFSSSFPGVCVFGIIFIELDSSKMQYFLLFRLLQESRLFIGLGFPYDGKCMCP